MRLIRGIEDTKTDLLVFNAYFCTKPPSREAINTLRIFTINPAFFVCRVLQMRGQPQIPNSVIDFVPIIMINLVQRPFSVPHHPDDAVSTIIDTIDFEDPIPCGFVDASRDLSRPPFTPKRIGFYPVEEASLRIIAKNG